MGMIGWVLELTPVQIAALKESPALATDLTQQKQAELREGRLAEKITSLPPAMKEAAEAWSRALLAQKLEMREALKGIITARNKVDSIGPVQPALGLEKSWHILHYLFTGSGLPGRRPGDMLLTGTDIGEDLGYGPARLHEAEETQAFATFLGGLDLVRLQQGIDLRKMMQAGIYGLPQGHSAHDEYQEELYNEVAAYFPALLDYVTKAAERKSGMLIWIS